MSTDKLLIQRETFDNCFEEALPLLDKHWREIAHYPDIPLHPDIERYRKLEQNGALRIYTARDDGRLIGYAVFVVSPNAHYSTSIQAVQDVVYIDRERRRGSVGLRLLRLSEMMLRAEGVQVVYHHVKAAHPALGTILARNGYEVVDLIYAKRLDVLPTTLDGLAPSDIMALSEGD